MLHWIITFSFYNKQDRSIATREYNVYTATENEAEKKGWELATKEAQTIEGCDWFSILEVK